jgi:hypothetical protein
MKRPAPEPADAPAHGLCGRIGTAIDPRQRKRPLTRLVFDEQMFGRILAEFLLILFVHHGAAMSHSLSNRPLIELEAIGQLV